MLRTLTRPAAAALLVALLATAACGGDDSSPNPTPDNALRVQTDALFPAATEAQAGDLADAIVSAADAGNDATAEARAFDLAELTLTEFYAGRLAPSAAEQPADIDQLLTDAFATAGLPDPGIEATNFTTDGLLAVVRSAGGTFTTASRFAGITIPNGATPRTTLLAVRRLPDSSAHAPKDGPLPTSLDQYPLFFDFSFTPEVTLSADGIIGLCQLSDPASAYYPGDAVFARMQLAHPDPANRAEIELLDLVDAPFLVCDGATTNARASLLLRRGGIGGRVRKFSPFAAVDPVGGTSGLTPVGSPISGTDANYPSATSLSADGTRLAISAHGAGAGLSRVYQRSGTTWTQIGADILGETTGDRAGYSLALSANGTRLAVGAYLNGGGGSAAGHVRVYDLVGSTWTQVGADIDGAGASQLGWSVAISANGSRVVAGAPRSGSTAGTARVFELTGGTWTQLGATISGGNEMGDAVDISDDGLRIAVGSSGAAGSTLPGTAQVYQWDGTAWVQLGNSIFGKVPGDNAGAALSLSANGSRIAVASPNNKDGGVSGGGSAAGQVRVFDLIGSTWTQVGGDVNGTTGLNGDNFGSQLSMSADGTRFIGSGPSQGVARVYAFSGGAWSKVGSDLLGGGRVQAVSISPDGQSAAVGRNQTAPARVEVFSVNP